MAHLERGKHTLRYLQAETVDEGVFVSDDREDLVEAEDRREALERVLMVRVLLDAPDKRLNVAWILFDLFVCHLFQAPFGKFCNSIAAYLSQGRIIPTGRAFNQRVKQALHLRVLINSAA